MSNAEIARIFDAIATMLEMDGANVFRVRAYREASAVVERLAEPASVLAQTPGRLQQIKGIGKDLEGKIRDLVTTGSTPTYAELAAKYPPTLMELTKLSGFGPKRVKSVFEKLGVKTLVDLKAAAESGKLRAIPGFGETVEKNVLKSLAAVGAGTEGVRMLLPAAWKIAHELADAVAAVKGVKRVEIAGSFRRRRETIGDLDLLALGGKPDTVMEAFVSHPYVAEQLGRGETKSSVRLGNGLQVDLRVIPLESFGAAMMYFTGSKQHNIELRKIALDRDMSLNEYGLTRGEEVVAARTEEDVYKALGLAWIPPELREVHDEIALARAGTLPKLVELSDLRADLHMHTDRSDGDETLLTMVRACKERGYEYCAITDHSKALGMTRGFDAARVRQSVGELAEVRRQVPGIHVLHGLEVDILADGTLDLDDETLGLLDWVIISLHSQLGQPRDVVTERVLKALDHPSVCVMGHPSGRRLGSRPGADIDFERVFERAAELGVAMEINAQPERLDLNDANARLAKRMGIRFTIDTDAHTIPELDNLKYAVFQARRAGLEASDVMNTLAYGDFMAWKENRREAAAARAKVVAPAVKAKAARVKTETQATPAKPAARAAKANSDAKAPRKAAGKSASKR